jgi:hypothetical protein
MSGQGLHATGEERVMIAAFAMCTTLKEKGREIELNGIRVDLLSAGRSRDVTDALLSIGLTSLHLGAPGILDTIDLPSCPKTVSVVFDYAIDIAPRLEQDPEVIDGAGTIALAKDMKARFLDPGPDPVLIRNVGVIAQMVIDGHLALGPVDPMPGGGGREQ